MMHWKLHSFIKMLLFFGVVFNAYCRVYNILHIVRSNSLHQLDIPYITSVFIVCSWVVTLNGVVRFFPGVYLHDILPIGNVHPFETAFKQIELYKCVFESFNEPTSFISLFFFPASYTFISMAMSAVEEKSTATANICMNICFCLS